MPGSNQISFFSDARNLRINNGIFNAVVQGYNGIEALSKNIASAAIHNSAARQGYPRCHPSTRKDSLRDIMSWVKNPARNRNIIWLNGSAGAGKSAILQTLAETCETQGLLAASFFFVRCSETTATDTHSTNLNTGERFFATIAYQLAVAIDELQEHVDAVVRGDPTIATKGMARQMEKLILGPMGALLKLYRLDELRLPPVIIIDGLEECADEKQQKDILRLLLDACTSRRNEFPFCIIISSRVEFALDNSSKFQHVAKTIALDDRRNTKATQEDIRTYLRAEFDRIRSSDPIYKMRLVGSPKTPWPSDYIVNMLATKSSGQFVYASTVIDFVSNPDCSPDDQLRIMLVLLTGRSSPMLTQMSSLYGASVDDSSSSLTADAEALGPLDSLYRDILEKCSDKKRTLAVLGHVLAMSQVTDAYCATWGAPLNTGVILHVIDHFLRLGSGNSERVMRRLQPLISLARLKELRNGSGGTGQTPSFGAPNTPGRNVRARSVDEQIATLTGAAIKFSHASFSDFLQKPARAGRFSINLSEVHAQITRACLRVMSGFRWENATRDEYLVWVYAILFWCRHCTEVKGRKERNEILDTLRQFDVSASWILPQTLPSLGSVNEMRLREALGTIGIQELKDCPGQGRWSFGDPNLQSTMKELKSVTTWMQRSNEVSNDPELIKRYETAFTTTFLHHLNESPNKKATLFILGILRSGEVSEHMLLDITHSSESFVDIMQSTKVFLYRYTEPSPSSKLSGIQHHRLGLKSEAFSRFLDTKHHARRILNSDVYQDIALSLLGLAEDAIAKSWAPVEYSQAWTYSLFRTKDATHQIIDQLAFATQAYLSSSYLQRGLRRYHAKRVLSWINLKRPITQRLAILAAQWSSPPIWKSHWHLDTYHSVEPFPSPTPYELSVVYPSDNLWHNPY